MDVPTEALGISGSAATSWLGGRRRHQAKSQVLNVEAVPASPAGVPRRRHQEQSAAHSMMTAGQRTAVPSIVAPWAVKSKPVSAWRE
jgi:hypothetical protein